MTDDAEKAAIGDAFQRHQEAERKADLLAREMAKIGKELTALGDVLRHPQDYSILVETETITIGKAGAGLPRPVAEVRPPYLNWENVSRLILDYQDTLATKHELAGKLGLKR